jgi:mono/diheme cytochrome c family protein
MLDSIYAFLARLGYAHPIHPTEVHMPIGLVVGAFIFAWIALLFQRPRLAQTAYHCIVLAFIWLFPTVLFGVMDWQHYYAGAMPFPIKMKLILAPVLLVLLAGAVLLGRGGGAESKAVLTSYGLCFLVVVILGYFGGQLVYGVQGPSLPDELKAGARLFAAHCSSCHPQGGNIINPDLPLKDSPQLADPNVFVAFIRNPKMPDGSAGSMPAFPPAQISDREAESLYEYVVQTMGYPTRK